MKKYFVIIISLFFSLNSFTQQNVPQPPNTACEILFNEKTNLLQLKYEGNIIASAYIKEAGKISIQKEINGNAASTITQKLHIKGNAVIASGIINGSGEAITAETVSPSQERFPLVRTTIGHASRNLRNNAVYDRWSDWMLEITNGDNIVISPSSKQNKKGVSFSFTAKGNDLVLTFRPLYYQKHKGITYFQPRSYKIWKQPVTGWSSWWAYFRQFNEGDLNSLLQVWNEKRLYDFGYKYIQIDDAYQGEGDKGHLSPPDEVGPRGYYATGPSTWLKWKKDLFPAGVNGYVKNVKAAGFTPAVWMGAFFTATDTAINHPDWFIQDKNGKPSVGPWITYAINAKNKEAVETLIRPIFKGWKNAGMKYVKIDQLRHYLYDNMNRNLDFFKSKGYTPDEVLRAYMKVAREEMGTETFILSCWGVLPQVVGIADACRIGGDGYGPVTMQQYNSWNGIVWINDPDHCDVYPHYKPAETGNVKNTTAVTTTPGETKLRPSLASVAGCMLILSDKPEVYKNDQNLEGVKRASPVLFSVPGQMYDFDPVKTSRLPKLDLQSIKSGAGYSPIDADQFGQVCPWWLNEINRDFESWNVLSHMNWTKEPFSKQEVKFSDIGLNPSKQYLVFEFWNKQFIGLCKESFIANELAPGNIHTYAIREKTNHPQIVSTNRHISQGGHDLEQMVWNNSILSGKSKVVKGDMYELYVYIPDGYKIKNAVCNGVLMKYDINNLLVLQYMPVKTGEVEWRILFEPK